MRSNLQNTERSPVPDAKKLETVQQRFDEYVTQHANVTYERNVFNTPSHVKMDESIEAYIRQVKHPAKTCNFPILVRSDLLRDIVVCGIRDNGLRKRLLCEEKKKLTLRTVNKKRLNVA